MAQAVTLNAQTSIPALAAHESCCQELIACIQAIWNSIYAWISDLASRLLSWNQNPNDKPIAQSTPAKSSPTQSPIPKQSRNLAKQCFNAFRQMTQFLEPVEIIQCEAVCKSWKD